MALLETTREWTVMQPTHDGRADGRADGRSDGAEVERTLLRRGLAGDRSALQELLALHERSVLVLCKGVLAHAEDGEDAAQETFYRALKALPGFRGSASFKTWLTRIAINVCLDWKRSRPRPASLHDLTMIVDETSPSPEGTVVGRLHARALLSRLQPRHRALIVMKEVQGRTAAEIAEAFQWNEAKVRNELFKARRILAEARKDLERA